MTNMNDRERAMENKFFRDEESNFRAVSLRRKKLGQWAAEQMRKDPKDVKAYADTIVEFGIDHKEDGAVVDKILEDIRAVGLDVDEETVRLKMAELHREAVQELERKFQEE